MSKLSKKINNAGRTSLNIGGNAVKVTLATIFGAAATELTFFGLKGVENEVNAGKALYKFKKDPDVYSVKQKGFFKKAYNVNINPITGEMKKDNTGKAPLNKKPIILK